MKVIKIIYKIHSSLSYWLLILRSFFLARLFKRTGGNVIFGFNGHLRGCEFVTIGKNTKIRDYYYLSAWCLSAENDKPDLTIGDNCSIGPFSHITCSNEIHIGDNVLTGKSVTITDNSHGNSSLEDLSMAPLKRKIISKGPVYIGNNVWIGDKATILPGVTIGECSIIGANSVVTQDVPPYSVVVGSPAKIVKCKKVINYYEK